MTQESCHIDGFGPLPVEEPATVAELGGLVRAAREASSAIYPIGGRTRLGLGFPPTKPGHAVDLRKLQQIIDYPARDMTITVQAGITIAQLRDHLQKENQQLPVDIPQSDQATIGGALATNTSGSRRYGHGTLRDYLIGITLVNDEGQETKAGGRVVKNVAGYDLCKLHIGALGTLGIITQVTLKLRPLTEEKAVVLIGCQSKELAAILDTLHASRTRPVCLEVLSPAARQACPSLCPESMPQDEWLVVVGLEEKQEAVNWQVQQLITEVPMQPVRHLDVRVGDTSDPIWHDLVEWSAGESQLAFQANMLSSGVAGFLDQASSYDVEIPMQAHAGNGIVLGLLPDSLDLDRCRKMLAELRQQAGSHRGNLVITRCPAEWKKELPLWGAPRGDLEVMRAINQEFDPRNIFNPGRFLV